MKFYTNFNYLIFTFLTIKTKKYKNHLHFNRYFLEIIEVDAYNNKTVLFFHKKKHFD